MCPACPLSCILNVENGGFGERRASVSFMTADEVASSGSQIIKDVNRLHGGNKTLRDPEDPGRTVPLPQPLLFQSKKRTSLQLPPVGDVQHHKNKHFRESGTRGTRQSLPKTLLKC